MNKKEIKKDEALTIDMLHYKSNRLSFWLIILAILLNIFMFLIIYKTTACTPGLQLAIDLLVNVMFMLVCFLAAEKTKHYSKLWGITSVVIGGIQILRIFWIPLYYFLKFVNTGSGLNVPSFVWCIILLVLSGVSIIIAGIFTLIKEQVISTHRPLLEIEGEKKDVRT